jgi:WD40 repeat protein
VAKKVFEKIESKYRGGSRKTVSSNSSVASATATATATASEPGSPSKHDRTPKSSKSRSNFLTSPDRDPSSPTSAVISNTIANQGATPTSEKNAADSRTAAAAASSASSGKSILCPVRDDHIHSGLCAVHEEAKLLFSCGHWDHTFKVTSIETCKLLQSVGYHRDVVTCLALASDYFKTWLVTGSRDCTVMVWEVLTDKEHPVVTVPLFTLFGHDDSVTCLCINPKLNVVISGSDDGTLILSTLREGTYTRSIVVGPIDSQGAMKDAGDSGDSPVGDSSAGPSDGAPVTMGKRRINWVGVTFDGCIVAYVMDDFLLCSYSINGRQLASRTIKDKLHALVLSTDGKVLVTGGNCGLIVLRWVCRFFLEYYSIVNVIYCCRCTP